MIGMRKQGLPQRETLGCKFLNDGFFGRVVGGPNSIEFSSF